ncbi:MAG: thiol-disulfide oxidoreductase [Desulfovibrio sp.]|jgi:hypothetical protein|nr:thiol-disulfide oxidoreductase [Desulfovibrio sp.]
MCYVVVPHPLGMIPANEVHAKVDTAFDDIVTAATKWTATKEKDTAQVNPYPARRITFTGTYAELNKMFADRKWSLSLPIIPPTPELVAAMLKGTKRDPAEVVWVVPPRQGILTVEMVAVLGVMAGARPEHMPLLLACVEAFKQPEAAWRGTSTTTAATYPMMVISGPIIEKMGLNSGTGVIGPENPVTNALGYFINLVGDVVGGSIPPNLDKSTHGTSADFVATVFVENAKANPWKQSYAEYRGFKATDSVLTVSTSYPANGNIDHNSVKSTDLLNTFAAGIAGTSSGIASCLTTYDSGDMTWLNNVSYAMLMVAPEHASTIAQDFPTLRSVQEYLVRETGLPFKYYAPDVCKPGPEYGKVTPDTIIPRFTKPESIHIVVTGGPGKQSQFWTPFPQVVKPVMVKIEDN